MAEREAVAAERLAARGVELTPALLLALRAHRGLTAAAVVYRARAKRLLFQPELVLRWERALPPQPWRGRSRFYVAQLCEALDLTLDDVVAVAERLQRGAKVVGPRKSLRLSDAGAPPPPAKPAALTLVPLLRARAVEFTPQLLKALRLWHWYTPEGLRARLTPFLGGPRPPTADDIRAWETEGALPPSDEVIESILLALSMPPDRVAEIAAHGPALALRRAEHRVAGRPDLAGAAKP